MSCRISCLKEQVWRKNVREFPASEYHAGQTAFAAGVAAARSPYVGEERSFFFVAGAVTEFDRYRQVGLKFWRALESERRAADEETLRSLRRALEAVPPAARW